MLNVDVFTIGSSYNNENFKEKYYGSGSVEQLCRTHKL